jgi:phosphoribosylformylglycinamidine synthase subunit PurS
MLSRTVNQENRNSRTLLLVKFGLKSFLTATHSHQLHSPGRSAFDGNGRLRTHRALLRRVIFTFIQKICGLALDRYAKAALHPHPSMKAKVIVMPKASILDPQGVAVCDAMRHHGLSGVKSVRIGKMIDLELETADESTLHEIARDMLSNPVIEDYQLIVEK